MKKNYLIMFAILLLCGGNVKALTFDADGKAVVSFSDLTVTGGLTFDQTTGLLTNDGTGGTLSVSLPSEGVDMSKVTSITVSYSGDNTILSYLHMENVDGTKINDWYNSRYAVNFSSYASSATSVAKMVWNGSKVAGTMTLESIVIKKSVEASSSDSISLTKDMYHVWSDATASATITTGAVTFTDGINQELSKGSTIYGNPSVSYLQYADLSSYSKMVLKGTAGQTVRALFNRATASGSDYVEIKPTFDDNGEATIDLATNFASAGFVHLNVIKVPSGSTSTVTVTKIVLCVSGSTGIDEITSRSIESDNRVYNLYGQMVKANVQDGTNDLHGIYITGGKKHLFK